jgi:hypothetical protein
MGLAMLHLVDFENAGALLKESLPLVRRLSVDSRKGFYIALNLAGLSEMARRRDQFTRSARLLGAAEAIVASLGDLIGNVWATDRETYESLITAGHKQMDRTAWLEGQAMSEEEMLVYALEDGSRG